MGERIGVVYAVGTGAIRYVIVPDRDAELESFARNILAGEAMLEMPVKDAETTERIQAEIARVSGKTPVKQRAVRLAEDGTVEAVIEVDPTRCAVVGEDGTVEAVIMADPAIDVLPGKTLVLCAADVGDRWDGKALFKVVRSEGVEDREVKVVEHATAVPGDVVAVVDDVVVL